MGKTHYETLGIGKESSASEVRSAYRKLVLKHHPDRSQSTSHEKFIEITEAYEVLGNAERRKAYDATLELEEQRERVRRTAATPKTARPRTAPAVAHAKPAQAAKEQGNDLSRLSVLMAMNRYVEAEELARAILKRNPKEAAAFGILGDIARARGRFDAAIDYFARAVQADPRNPSYVRRHDELVLSAQKNSSPRAVGSGMGALLATALVCVAACAYLAFAREPAGFHMLAPISTWGGGTAAMLFISGVAIGAGFSASGQVDRLSAVFFTSLGKASPIVTLGVVAVVSFWAAALLYIVTALIQNTFNYSITRVIGVIAVVISMAGFASCFSAILNPWQVLVWGGNLCFIGAICGWTVADSFRA